MRHLSVLALVLSSLLLFTGCGDKEERPAVVPVSAAKLLADPNWQSFLPPSAAWLGPPQKGQAIFNQPSEKGSTSVLYASGNDLVRLKVGQPPLNPVIVTTTASKPVRAQPEASLDGYVGQKTKIGKALIDPSKTKAIILLSDRTVVVTTKRNLRKTLGKLSWFADYRPDRVELYLSGGSN